MQHIRGGSGQREQHVQAPRVSLTELIRRNRAAQRLARDAREVRPARPLDELTALGSDPGNLRGLCFVPAGLPDDGSAALVVAMHGCTQTAAAYDLGCGWSVLAERAGFALLLPEQRRANNQNLCFNWFEPGDTSRDAGEVGSIRQMIAAMVARHHLDPDRVFVTGLSAGGAMTAAMLAAYPEVFGGGAIVAGLPYRSAASVSEAFEAMRGGASRSAGEWGDAVRAASPRRPAAERPPVSIWHGDADATVLVGNATSLTAQWTDALGLQPAPDETRTEGRDTVSTWRDATGRVTVERHIIAGMGHGAPLSPGEAANQCGVAGPFLLDVGLSSTLRIAESWGLTEPGAIPAAARPAMARRDAGYVVTVDAAGDARVEANAPAEHEPQPSALPGSRGPGDIVQDALALARNAHRLTPAEIVRDALAMTGLLHR